MLNISIKEYKQLTEFIRNNYGINLSMKKQSLVLGRLHNVLAENNFSSLSQYYDYLMADKTGNAVATLLDKITTNHTFFMREVTHFYFFRDTVLPYLAKKAKAKDLRIWSAGCSSGEEPYTLAMLMADYFGPNKSAWDTKILATDISNKVLDIAVKGLYSNEEIASLPAKWRMNYFNRVDHENSVLVDKIKNEVIFRRFNLMDKFFPFRKKFHVIFCRNVMIYFDSKTKNQLVNRFYDFLEPGGYLFIGHPESLSREETSFKYVLPAVYRKE